MTYLVEYKMLWAGKVVKQGIEEVEAYDNWGAEKQVREELAKLNKKAEIRIGDVVKV